MGYLREKGRLRHQEKSFEVHFAGDPDSKHSIQCVHGWYHATRFGSKCVKCGKPEAVCVAELSQEVTAQIIQKENAETPGDPCADCGRLPDFGHTKECSQHA